MSINHPETYRVKVVKRDGRLVVGTIRDDGLQSLWPVEEDSGGTSYVSVLDEWIEKEKV